jgi:integrase
VAKRRANGEGTTYQRKDGKWVGSLTVGWSINPKTQKSVRQRKVVYGANQQEVSQKLTRLKADRDRGIAVPMERQTVAQFLELWLRDVVKPSVRDSTYRSYEGHVRNHIVPELGRIQLTKLTAQNVQAMLNRKATSEALNRDGARRALSPRTIQYTRAVLRKALNQAVKWDLVPRNVAALADPLRSIRKEIHPLSIEQAKKLLQAVNGDRLEALYTVAVAVGLRQGEAFALRWRDVDFDACTLTVNQTVQRVGGKVKFDEPKTARSRRTIALPTPCLTRLLEHKELQREEQIAAGRHWLEYNLVFTTTTGTPLDPSNVRRQFKAHLRAAGLPIVRFHDLRHTAASILVAEGVHPRTVMEVLGHSQIGITMNLYSHVMDEAKRDAADRMGAVFASSKGGRV